MLYLRFFPSSKGVAYSSEGMYVDSLWNEAQYAIVDIEVAYIN